jgi:hypothetical protein
MLIFSVKVVSNHLSVFRAAIFLALLALQLAVHCQLFCRQSSF